MFSIEMLAARNGDALWIEYGDPDQPSRFLIDGGVSGTIDAIENRIHEIADTEGICKLELLVVTHIDADHIEAIARMVGGAWRGDDPRDDELLELCFNYRSDFNKQWDDDALREKWNYSAVYSPRGAKGGLVVRL